MPTMDTDDQATAARVAVITGAIALGVSAIVGLELVVLLSTWRYVLPALVPATLATAAIASGPRGSVGRRLGWIAVAVIAVAIAAGLMFHAASPGPFGG